MQEEIDSPTSLGCPVPATASTAMTHDMHDQRRGRSSHSAIVTFPGELILRSPLTQSPCEQLPLQVPPPMSSDETQILGTMVLCESKTSHKKWRSDINVVNAIKANYSKTKGNLMNQHVALHKESLGSSKTIQKK